MPISRRDFFAEAFSKAVSNIPKLIPKSVQGLIGIKKDPPLSAEEAAFELVRTHRKKSPTLSKLPDNIHSEHKEKPNLNK